MSTPIDLVRNFYSAIAKADIPAVLELLHPDLQWTEAEGFPYYSGTWTKPEDVVEKMLIPAMRDWDGFSAVATDFVVEGERVVSIGTYGGTSRATGKSLRVAFAHIWRIADGKLKCFDMYTDTLLIDRALR